MRGGFRRRRVLPYLFERNVRHFNHSQGHPCQPSNLLGRRNNGRQTLELGVNTPDFAYLYAMAITIHTSSHAMRVSEIAILFKTHGETLGSDRLSACSADLRLVNIGTKEVHGGERSDVRAVGNSITAFVAQ